MNHALKMMLEETGDLLYRVRIYDRDLKFAREIEEMDERFAELSRLGASKARDLTPRQAVEQLESMRHRLVTMFEDLLFIAG